MEDFERDPQQLLYRLMYCAFIEIRAQAYKQNHKAAFDIADLFHNTPLQIYRMEQGEITPEEVIPWLRTRARQKGIESWLEQRMVEETK